MNAKSKKPDQELPIDDVTAELAQDQELPIDPNQDVNQDQDSDQNQEKITELVRMVRDGKFADIHPLEVDHMLSHNWLLVHED